MTVDTRTQNPFQQLSFIDLWRMVQVASSHLGGPLSVRKSKHLAGQLQGEHGDIGICFETYRAYIHADPTGESAVRAVLSERGY